MLQKLVSKTCFENTRRNRTACLMSTTGEASSVHEILADASDGQLSDEEQCDTSYINQRASYYEVLRVSIDVDQVELKARFQATLDVIKGQPNKINWVTRAYTVLSDPKKRDTYNKELQEQDWSKIFTIEAWKIVPDSLSNEVKLFATIAPECFSNRENAFHALAHERAEFDAAVHTISTIRNIVHFVFVTQFRRSKIKVWNRTFGTTTDDLFVHLNEFEKKVKDPNMITQGTVIEYTHTANVRPAASAKRSRCGTPHKCYPTAMNVRVANDSENSHWCDENFWRGGQEKIYDAFFLSALLGQVGGTIHNAAKGESVRAGSAVAVDFQNASQCPVNIYDRFVFVLRRMH